MSNKMILLVSFLIPASHSFSMFQRVEHKHVPNEKQHGLEGEKDSSLKVIHYLVGSKDEHDAAGDKEAVLDLKKDAEDFGDLPLLEAKRQLNLLLGKMDLNFDEHIDKTELHAWVLKSFNDEDTTKERFEEADSDTSGFVTWNELTKSEYFDVQEGDDQWVERNHYLFKAADKDSSGSLTLKEFTSFVLPDGDLEMQRYVLNQTLGEKDTDKNGLLNFGEFIGNRDKDHDKEWFDTKDIQFNFELDKDADGSLNSVEIVAWIIPDGSKEMIANEATHLISEADQDEDGVLSFEEILDNVHLFAYRYIL